MKKWCGNARGGGASVRDLGWRCTQRRQTERVRERRETGKRERDSVQREGENGKREMVCKERENGKRESKVIYELRRESDGI